MLRTKNIIFAALLYLLFALNADADVDISASLDRTIAQVGDHVVLVVSIESTEGEPEAPVLPDIENVDIIGSGRSSSSSMQFSFGTGGKGMVNTSKVDFRYTLIPSAQGTIDISGISTIVDGKKYTADPVRLTVGGQSAAPPQISKQNSVSVPDSLPTRDDIFLRIRTNTNEAYVGQQIQIVYTLYSLLRVRGADQDALENVKYGDVWKESIPNPTGGISGYNQMINGKKYSAFDLKKICIFPLSAGEISIDPVQIVCSVIDNKRRRGNSFFDSFFDQTKNISVISNSLKIDVKPFPEEEKPENFSGMVGNYSLDVEVDKTEVEVGDAVTLKVRIFGEGNIEGIKEPILPPLKNFSKYEPSRKENISRSRGIIEGEVIYEYILVPKEISANTIDPVQINFFNPDEKKYFSLKSQAIKLNVLPSSKPQEESIILQGGEGKRKIVLHAEDLKHIITDLEKIENQGRIFYWNSVFWILMVCPVLVIILSLLFKWRISVRTNDPIRFKQREAFKIAKKELSVLKNKMDDQYFSGLSKIITDYISDRFNCKAGGMTTDALKEMLDNNKVSDETSTTIKEMLNTLDGARFAPGSNTEGRKLELLQEVSHVLEKLEKQNV